VHALLAPVEATLYAHAWRDGDMVLFDNRSVMHSASGVPPKQQRRLLHQVILCGDQHPVGPAGVGVGNPTVNPRAQAVR
jgi:alpha-ketoglutarate-dependent taurine dioxygenase